MVPVSMLWCRSVVTRAVKRHECVLGLSIHDAVDGGERRLGAHMALFMDVHSISGGVTEADVAGAHAADLATQGKHDVNYLKYWVDEEAGKIFCLVEAPDAEAANTVHRDAHGLVADEIYKVSEHS
jgi:hypothetical protein